MKAIRPNPFALGFTLLEVVLTMGLMVALLFFSFAAYSHVVESTAVDAGAQLVSDALVEARQDALVQNTPVEVRFYAVTSTAGAPPAYGSLALRWVKSDGTTPPVARMVILPVAAVMDATPAHSSLVTINAQTPAADATDPRLNALTRDFHFLPDGSTDLASTGKWLVTVRAAAKSDPANFPANWACVEIDPVTGRTQVYRP